jgi:hypothetical protein
MDKNTRRHEPDPIERARQNKALMDGLKEALEGEERDAPDIPGTIVQQEARRRRVRTSSA